MTRKKSDELVKTCMNLAEQYAIAARNSALGLGTAFETTQCQENLRQGLEQFAKKPVVQLDPFKIIEIGRQHFGDANPEAWFRAAEELIQAVGEQQRKIDVRLLGQMATLMEESSEVFSGILAIEKPEWNLPMIREYLPDELSGSAGMLRDMADQLEAQNVNAEQASDQSPMPIAAATHLAQKSPTV